MAPPLSVCMAGGSARGLWSRWHCRFLFMLGKIGFFAPTKSSPYSPAKNNSFRAGIRTPDKTPSGTHQPTTRQPPPVDVRRTHTFATNPCITVGPCNRMTSRPTDRRPERSTDRPTDRQTDNSISLFAQPFVPKRQVVQTWRSQITGTGRGGSDLTARRIVRLFQDALFVWSRCLCQTFSRTPAPSTRMQCPHPSR